MDKAQITLPEGWSLRLSETADLEAARRELPERGGDSKVELAHARVSLLQLRMNEAGRRISSALLREEECAEVRPEVPLIAVALAREERFLRQIYRKVLEPTPFEQSENPSVTAALLANRALDGAESIASGDTDAALGAFRDCLENRQCEEDAAFASVGIATCFIPDDLPEARRWLEVAGFHSLDPCCRTLGRVRLAARIGQVYEYLGEDSSASEWFTWLDRIRCPQATKLAAIRRAATMLSRSRRCGRCLC